MRRFNFDLAPGELFDLGLNHYGEFACSVETAEELCNGGMVKVDGDAGTLVEVERFENAVQLRWVFAQDRAPKYGNPLG